MAGARSVRPLSLLVWLQSFEIDEADLDRQHRKLMADLNELTELVFEGGVWPAIVARSGELRVDSLKHFAAEERLLERSAYPGFAEHRAEHRRLVEQLDDIVGHMAGIEEPSRTDIEAALYLRSMLLDHFFRKDIAYKSHILMWRGR